MGFDIATNSACCGSLLNSWSISGEGARFTYLFGFGGCNKTRNPSISTSGSIIGSGTLRQLDLGSCCLHGHDSLREEGVDVAGLVVEHDGVRFLTHLPVHGHVVARKGKLCGFRTSRLLELRGDQVQGLGLGLRGETNGLGLTLRLKQQFLLRRLGLVLDLDEVTFGFVGEADLDSLRRQLRTLFVSLRPQDLFSTHALGCGLLVHGDANLLIRRDICDFVATDFQTPRHGRFLQASLDEGVQPRSVVQDLIEFQFTNCRAHRRLGVLRNVRRH
mmetsp:Transcript_19186/g.53299  ORF Transcript_19186/g.53299 Transcript_19186/m.53299 type:complete len:274 (+) Transcript_19186:92-913(+)